MVRGMVERNGFYTLDFRSLLGTILPTAIMIISIARYQFCVLLGLGQYLEFNRGPTSVRWRISGRAFLLRWQHVLSSVSLCVTFHGKTDEHAMNGDHACDTMLVPGTILPFMQVPQGVHPSFD